MILFHCTPRKNLPSVRRWGLSPGMARSRIKRIWMARKGDVQILRHHVARRHRVNYEDVAVLRLDIPQRYVRAYGTWRYTTDRHIHCGEISYV